MAAENQNNQHESGGIRNIAISLSGGGVRAVGFHLGTLEMLDRLDLLRKVSILSTVSGGSLTGTGYALSQQLGHSFDTYFHDFYDFLPNLNTLQHLLDGLASNAFPSPSGRRDMITVMANIYDDAYFRKYFGKTESGEAESPRFNVLLDGYREGSHLKEVIFNATEFQTGNAFRFQQSEYRSVIGNSKIRLCKKHAREIRMADIMAASSCIPAGMEPLFFPDDFHWPDDGDGPDAERRMCNEIKDSLRNNLHSKFRLYRNRLVDYFAIMDGGVYDNQGIVSLLLAMNRQSSKIEAQSSDECFCGTSLYKDDDMPGPEAWAKWFAGKSHESAEDNGDDLASSHVGETDLIIISDTPVRKDSMYPKIGQSASRIEPLPGDRPDRNGRWLGKLTVGNLDLIGWGVSALLLLSAGLTIYQAKQSSSGWVAADILQIVLSLLLIIGLSWVLLKARRWLRKRAAAMYELLPKSRWTGRKPWSYMKQIKLQDLLDMLQLRVGSVSAMTGSIFMNRIRSLGYSAAYTRENVEHHIVANQIFALEKTARGDRTKWPDGMADRVEALSDEASAIVTLAAHMATKLWINEITPPKKKFGKKKKAPLSEPLIGATEAVVKLNAARKSSGLQPLNDLDVLVICGQLTICYKLMTHLWRQHHLSDGTWSNAGSEKLFGQACEIWNRAANKPTELLDDRKGRAGVGVTLRDSKAMRKAS